MSKIINKIKNGICNYYNYFFSLKHISKNKKKVISKLKNNETINVVFIIQYIPGWNKLELIYKKMKEDSQINPIIICVPSEIKNPDVANNDTYKYFIEKAYDAYNALGEDNKWIDLKTFKPDYVFHSRPYNEFMPELYSSKEIVKYALICNVLYGPNISINGCNITLHKSFFRDCYCYFALDKGEEEFYKNRFWIGIKLGIQKCYPYGCVGLEQIINNVTPNIDNGFRKTVMWTPRWSTDPYIGGSNFFNYKDVMMELAEKNKDILFIIRPHPLMFDNFVKTQEMTIQEVDDFKTKCSNNKNIILDEGKEYIDEFKQSDLLITDTSAIISEFFILKKPIILCHSNAKFVYTSSAQRMVSSCYECYSKEELIRYFDDIMNENDSKKQERESCISSIFSEVNYASDAIISFMLNKRA